MVLRSGRDPSVPLEALRLYSLLDTRTSPATVIADALRVNAFVADLASGLTESLANSSRIHGFRAQSLFQAMIVGLGGVQLIKEEDIGDFLFDDVSGPVRLPDFRLVREDGQVLLVEVKTVNPKNPFGRHRLREADVDALRRYADLNGARLLLAHYWSAWNLWTLADAAVFERRDGKLIIDMETAMKASELGLLGDASIATVPPLTLSLIADPAAPQTALKERAGETEIQFTVGAVELVAGGEVLTDDVETTIATFLIQFGRWKLTENVVFDDGRLHRVNIVLTPEEPVPGQILQVVGQLSSMYSAMYMLATQSEAGEVLWLRHDVTPGMIGALIPADYFERPDRVLRLWKLIQQPSIGPESEG